MDLGLRGKIAIVTGASAGIGLACSKALFEEGASVIMVARDPKRMQQAVESIVQARAAEGACYIRMVKEAAPHMINQKDGRIVNIVGGAGRTPSPTFLAGSTANAALLNFTRGISKELAKSNVRINAISPGSTATERAERLAEQNALASGISVDEQKARMGTAIPLGHLVDPDEIASMALLLVSDRVPSITGTEIVIDGGQQPGV
jgi:NAD(P)-dependent dehydrogenase (short-subunit alcohol dehydrogenase family)